MDPIPKEEMGNATSMFNLMRNLGGSVGIATATTLIARTSQTFINDLVKNVNPYRLTEQSLLTGLRAYFIERGSDAVTATHQAYAAMNGMLGQQAALLAYINEFKFFRHRFDPDGAAGAADAPPPRPPAAGGHALGFFFTAGTPG